MPIWVPSENCYRFARLFADSYSSDNYGLTINDENIAYDFKHQINADINSLLLNDGAGDNAISVMIRLEWDIFDDEGAVKATAHQDFVYSDKFVGQVSTGMYRYTYDLRNYEALGITKENVRVYAYIAADCGVTTVSHEMQAK